MKQFGELNIEIYGTYENPSFKANDIGKYWKILEIQQIRKSIQNLDEQCKVLQPGNSITGLKEQWFLTEEGLYQEKY